MQTIVIVDDLIEHIHQIEDIIQHTFTNIKIETYTNPQNLLKNLEHYQEHTIFILDIMLDKINGIDLAQTILHVIKHAQIIFISSYLEKATDVYDVEHCYFVYKPELTRRLPLAIHKALDYIEQAHQTLVIQLKEKTQIINTQDIEYLERDKRTTYIHCQHEIIKTSMKLSEFISILPSMFVRCHNSYIVNLNHIKEYKREHFILNNNDYTIIPISRAYHQNVKEQFHKHISK